MSFRKFNDFEDSQLVTLVSSEGVEAPHLSKDEMRVYLEALKLMPQLVNELKKLNMHMSIQTDTVIEDKDI